jgi:polysaccharide biosynthesis/export protein
MRLNLGYATQQCKVAISPGCQQEIAEMTRIIATIMGIVLGLLSVLSPAFADGYALRAGDVIKIEVLEDPSLNRSVLVAPDGRVSIPLVGTIKASGLSVDAVAAEISARIASNFSAPPNVFVSLERLADRSGGSGGSGRAEAATISVYVMGEAAKSGKLNVAPGTTVLQLFAEMGGFSKFAATKRIQLRRTDARTKAESVVNLNYDAIEAGTSTNGNTTLKAGDVIVIPQRKLFE